MTDYERQSGRPVRQRILCIDDDPHIAGILQTRLTRYGVDVVRAFTGTDGYWIAVAEKPAAVVCDLSMPDGEGTDVLKRLRANPATADMPFIVLSGHRDAVLRRTLLSMGASAFLTKPIVLQELLRELRRHVDLEEQASSLTLTAAVDPAASTVEQVGNDWHQDFDRRRR